VELRSKAAVGEIEIRQVTHDSRKVGPGALFVAISGAARMERCFAREAVSRGAIAVASEVAAANGLVHGSGLGASGESERRWQFTAANFLDGPRRR